MKIIAALLIVFIIAGCTFTGASENDDRQIPAETVTNKKLLTGWSKNSLPYNAKRCLTFAANMDSEEACKYNGAVADGRTGINFSTTLKPDGREQPLPEITDVREAFLSWLFTTNQNDRWTIYRNEIDSIFS